MQTLTQDENRAIERHKCRLHVWKRGDHDDYIAVVTWEPTGERVASATGQSELAASQAAVREMLQNPPGTMRTVSSKELEALQAEREAERKKLAEYEAELAALRESAAKTTKTTSKN